MDDDGALGGLFPDLDENRPQEPQRYDWLPNAPAGRIGGQPLPGANSFDPAPWIQRSVQPVPTAPHQPPPTPAVPATPAVPVVAAVPAVPEIRSALGPGVNHYRLIARYLRGERVPEFEGI